MAGTVGRVDYRQERMGAGFAVGLEPALLLELSAPVGGPLSTLRSEVASFHALLGQLNCPNQDQKPQWMSAK